MCPTEGPVNAIICQLAWWAFDKMILEGKTPEQEVCPVESFSCQENIGVLCWKSTYWGLIISMTPAKAGQGFNPPSHVLFSLDLPTLLYLFYLYVAFQYVLNLTLSSSLTC